MWFAWRFPAIRAYTDETDLRAGRPSCRHTPLVRREGASTGTKNTIGDIEVCGPGTRLGRSGAFLLPNLAVESSPIGLEGVARRERMILGCTVHVQYIDTDPKIPYLAYQPTYMRLG